MVFSIEQAQASTHQQDALLPKVTLAKVKSEDIRMLHSWLSDERVYRWLDMGGGRQLLSVLQLQSLMMSSRTYARLASVPGMPAFGFVCLNDAQNLMGTAELWYLRGRYSGEPSRVMMSAILSVLASGFLDLKHAVISAWVADGNQSSLRLQQQIGMQQVGRQRARHVMDGQRHDRILFDMTLDEFGSRYPKLVSEQGLTYQSSAFNQNEACVNEQL